MELSSILKKDYIELNLKILMDSSINLFTKISSNLLENIKINNNFNNINKNEYLDPISVLIILALNSYKPIGTKISIYNNKIDMSDKNIFQSSIRTIYGDKKDDIKLLNQSIIYICNVNQNLETKKLNLIFKKALDGLYKLKKTYINDTTTCICLNNYIQKIEMTINNNMNVINYNNIDLINDNNDDNNENNDINIIKKLIFNKLCSVWNKDNIKIIINLLIELQKYDDEQIQYNKQNNNDLKNNNDDLKNNNNDLKNNNEYD